jgi:hypothetical protein
MLEQRTGLHHTNVNGWLDGDPQVPHPVPPPATGTGPSAARA